MDGQTDVWTYRFPVFYRPAYLKGYHKQTTQQGKGTDDHLLPLGDWFKTAMPFQSQILPTLFLDAFFHLYKRVCPSISSSVCPLVGLSLRWLVHPSVRLLVTQELKPCKSSPPEKAPLFQQETGGDDNLVEYRGSHCMYFCPLVPLRAP